MINSIAISKYSSAFSKVPELVLLIDEITKIKTGFYKQQIDACRDKLINGDKTGYNLLKANLPALTFSGVFKDSHRKENLVSYTKLIIIDIDNLALDILTAKKNEIFIDRHVLACWISPSGNGLKILFQLDNIPEFHKYSFDQITSYLVDNYGLDADKSGSDICRLCFVSDDVDLLIKSKAEPFPLTILSENMSATELKNKKNKTLIEKTQEINASEKVLFYKTEGRNDKLHRDTISKILTFLRKSEQSITHDYQSWYKVALAIANTFTYDLGEKYFIDLCRLDIEAHNEYKSKNLLEYCYRNRQIGKVTFATITYLASMKGFIVKKARPNKY